MIRYIVRYNKINKTEFAYLIYLKQSLDINQALDSMKTEVDNYRDGSIDIEVNVKVRNDLELRERTKSDKRKEGLTFLTSYGYFTSLLQQAGLVFKHENYFKVVEDKKCLLEQLGGV